MRGTELPVRSDFPWPGDLMRRLLLVPLALAGLASIIASGSGGSSGDETSGGDESTLVVGVRLSPAQVAVPQGQSATVRVDIDGLAANQSISGYSIDLSEVASRIDIDVQPCPTGVGTSSCRDWIIAPRMDSVPGTYVMRISAAGIPSSVRFADLTIRVIGTRVSASPAQIAASRLVMSTDGRLWASGPNYVGQAGVGFWNGCDDTQNTHCLQPRSITGYAPVGNDTWLDVAATDKAAVGVRSDKTAWAWGANDDLTLGFSSAATSEVQVVPFRVPEIENARQVSTGFTKSRPHFLALTEGGNVYAWGGNQEDRCGFVPSLCNGTRTPIPRLVPIDVDADGNGTPLGGVVQIAGGSNNVGRGFALARRSDGTIWQWGGGTFVEGLNIIAFRPGVLPTRVVGLPNSISSIAAGTRNVVPNGSTGFALALAADRTVWTWDELSRTPVPVAGLSSITAIDADIHGNATALDSSGTVWHWRPGSTQPSTVIGLPTISGLGRGSAGQAIAADCPGGGSLWESVLTDSPNPPLPTRSPWFGAAAPGACTAGPTARLTVVVTGSGRVNSEPSHIDCGTDCEVVLPVGTALAMHKTPVSGWELVSALGDPCASERLVIQADMLCRYEFKPEPAPKTLSISVSAGGRVISDPAGIDCPDDCAENYFSASGTAVVVRLTATADPGYRFGAFSGHADCAGGSVTMGGPRQCAAEFLALPAPAQPAGLTATATASFVDLAWTAVSDNSVVRYRLERSEGGGAYFTLAEFDGSRSSRRDLTVVPGAQYSYRLTASNVSGSSPPATVAVAIPIPSGATLSVQASGPGSVASSPPGINCPPDCSEVYPLLSVVTLNAVTQAGGRFDGWGADCAGTAPGATVTMNADRTCTAQFSDDEVSGWRSLDPTLAANEQRDLVSSLALNHAGLAHVAYLQTVNSQSRLNVRREGIGHPLLGPAFNANATWNAFNPQIIVDAAGMPVVVFSIELDDVVAARWNGTQWDYLRPDPATLRLNLTANDAHRPHIARSGNTLLVAWIEMQRIALRRYSLDTQQWDAGAFVPGPTNPSDIDLTTDSNGRAVLAWSDGLLGTRLHAIRETSPGTWSPLGGEIGTRPANAPNVLEFGIHVDSSDTIRMVWIEGDTFYYGSVAQFDGTDWVPLPDRSNYVLLSGVLPLRSLSVNPEPAVFALAIAMDVDPRFTTSPSSYVTVWQWTGPGGILATVGDPAESIRPRVGRLSLAMRALDRATLTESEFQDDGSANPYTLVLRRHVP